MLVNIKKDTVAEFPGNNLIHSNIDAEVSVIFSGCNNCLFIDNTPTLNALRFEFDCSNGEISIGRSRLSGRIRVGQDSKILIGDYVTSTNAVFISTAEGAKIIIGRDVMIASDVIVRGEDSHAIYDVSTGKRVNVCKDVVIGDHVWISERAMILSGSKIGNGSIIGMASLVKSHIPNNSIAVGVPATVIKKNVAWERPHLTYHEPYYKLTKPKSISSEYWNLTSE